MRWPRRHLRTENRGNGFHMKVLVVDDHLIVREGIRDVLAAEGDITIVEARSSEEALDLCAREKPDLVILDLNLGDSSGMELLRRLLQADKGAKVLILSMYFERVFAAGALEAGARGYLSKNARPEEFLDAVRKVGKGGRYVERDIATELVIGKFSDEAELDSGLTAREIDLLRLLREGKSYTQMAAAIGVSCKTIANAFGVIRKKLAVETTTDLIRLSARAGVRKRQ
jgi:two-component system, NarL family, invasion response regulator UvrY